MKLIDIVNPQPVTEYGIWARQWEHMQAKFQVFNHNRIIIKIQEG